MTLGRATVRQQKERRGDERHEHARRDRLERLRQDLLHAGLRGVGIIAVILLCLLPASAEAVTEYYLDPDWTGTKSGTQAQPFASLDAAAWTTINTALASGDVTVYCSARNASADTDQVWAQDVVIDGNKTASPTGTLTLDGRSKYNSSDTVPSWTTYSGTSRCKVQYVGSQNASHVKYNKVTLDGLKISQGTSVGKGLAICGDDWIVKNADISHQTGVASGGPLVLIVPTADGSHDGSASWCPQSNRITIQDNVIHDSFGELIYVGGAGCNNNNEPALGATNCNGFPSHGDITISGNTLSGCGSRVGAEGDCIDIKAAITNLTIARNDITGSTVGRCIVTQGIQTDGTDQNVLIERNNIHDCSVTDGAITLANSWGTPNGVTIRTNLIVNTTTSSSGGTAILSYGTQSSPGLKVYSNTLYSYLGAGVAVVATTVTITDNAFLSATDPLFVSGGSNVITSSFNAYSGTWSGTCTSCVSGLTSAAFASVGSQNFLLVSGSVLKDAGTTIASFSNDYAGTTRPTGAAWDIGAYEYTGANGHTRSGGGVAKGQGVWK